MAGGPLARLRSKEAAPPNGRHGAPPRDLAIDESPHVAEQLGALRLTPDQLRVYRQAEGSDTDPWDVMLSMLAMDEQQALTKLAERTGLEFRAEPRLQESASTFYESVPPELARQQNIAGVDVVVVTESIDGQ